MDFAIQSSSQLSTERRTDCHVHLLCGLEPNEVSYLSRAPCQLAKDSRSHVESLSLSKTQKHEGRLAETGSLVYNGQI